MYISLYIYIDIHTHTISYFLTLSPFCAVVQPILRQGVSGGSDPSMVWCRALRQTSEGFHQKLAAD